MKESNSSIISISALLIFILYTFISYPEGDNINDILLVDNQFYALFLTICILIYALENVIKKGLSTIVNTDVLLVQSFIYWSLLDIIQSRYPLTNVSLYSIKYTFIYLAVFILFIIIGTQISFKFPNLVTELSKVDISEKSLFTFFIISFIISIFYFWKASYYDFNYMISALNRPRFSAPWARGVEGGLGAIYEHLKYFGYFLPSLAVLYAIKIKKLNFKVILLFSLAVFFSAFEFQGGGRRITGFLAGVGIVTYLVYKRNNLKVRHFIVLGASAGLLLILLDMQLAFRNKGYDGMFDTYEIENLNEVRVDDNFYRIAQLIDWIPNDYPHAGMQWVIYSLGRPIPRFFWEGKPLDPGYDVARMANEPGVTLTTTIVGEAYASAGIIMIIIVGIFYGALAGTLKTLLTKDLGIFGFALYSLGTLAIIGGVRALVDLIIFSYAFLGLVFLYKFILRKKLLKENQNLSIKNLFN